MTPPQAKRALRPACPICREPSSAVWAEATDLEYYTTSKPFKYMRCAECDCLFIHPIPLHQLPVIYPANYYSFVGAKESVPEKIKQWMERFFFKKWLRTIAGSRLSALDIGGGNGWMLQVLKKADPRVVETWVVDISPKAKKEAEASGHRYFTGRVEKFKTHRKFDFVLMLNLIEHIHEPLKVLKKIERLMNPGGVLLLKTPNINSWDADVFRHLNWAGYHCPRHWTLFSSKSIQRMVSSTQLRLESLSYTQGASFWAQSVIIYLMDKGFLRRNKKIPVVYHPLCPFLMSLFAALDLLRKPLFKTSQMFILLRKNAK